MFGNLRAALRDHHISTAMLARILGVTEKTANNKLSGVTDWTWTEIQSVRTLFPQYQLDWLFATDNKSA